MKTKIRFYTEATYVLGIIALALGTALMERADFGMSMVVAPAYLLHLKISQIHPWFTFGVAEYCLQAVLLVCLAIFMRRFKPMYLFSFVTAFFYGNVLDVMIAVAAPIPCPGIPGRVIFFVVGMFFCALGVSLVFHTYIAPEAYELVVKEINARIGGDINKEKLYYDCISCAVAVVMSFAFYGFGQFVGVQIGTIICALLNGRIIGAISRCIERYCTFPDALPLRKYFR